MDESDNCLTCRAILPVNSKSNPRRIRSGHNRLYRNIILAQRIGCWLNIPMNF